MTWTHAVYDWLYVATDGRTAMRCQKLCDAIPMTGPGWSLPTIDTDTVSTLDLIRQSPALVIR